MSSVDEYLKNLDPGYYGEKSVSQQVNNNTTRQKDPYYTSIVDKAKKKVKNVLCSTIKKHVMNASQQVPVMERVLEELSDEVDDNNFCASEKSTYQNLKGLFGYGGFPKFYKITFNW